MAVDKEGRIYNAGCNGIQVYSAQGKHLSTIPTARQIQNLAFAGPDKKTLYLVGRSAARKIETLTRGSWGGQSRKHPDQSPLYAAGRRRR